MEPSFDVNTSMCLLLGTNFKDQTPHIVNPLNNEKIFVFYDPAHMLKLV